MLSLLLAQADTFKTPHLDYAALSPELVLTGVLVAVLLLDLVVDETRKYLVTQLAGVGVLVTIVPVIALAVNGDDRSMFAGAYVVDDFALLFLSLIHI